MLKIDIKLPKLPGLREMEQLAEVAERGAEEAISMTIDQ